MYSRFSRQTMISSFGEDSQKLLFNASVLVVGAGGLGTCALFLTHYGIGKIGIVDGDKVEPSNLNRQILHKEGSLGEYKTSSALNFLIERNSEIKFKTYSFFIKSLEDMENIWNDQEYDVIIAATDNLESRFILGDFCALKKVPLVYGTVWEFTGQLTTYIPGNACLRCMFPTWSENSRTKLRKGIVGTTCGVVASLMAEEAVRILSKRNPLFAESLFLIDIEKPNQMAKKLKLRGSEPKCPFCGQKN